MPDEASGGSRPREIFHRIRDLAVTKLGIPAHQVVLAVPGYDDQATSPSDIGGSEAQPVGWAQRQSRVFATARVAVDTVDQALEPLA
jgi:hypothetical protein